MLLLNVLITLATFSTTLTATLFAIYQVEKKRRSTYAVKDSDVPVLEAQDRADAIVKNAAEKAKASLLAAEQEGTNLVNEYKQVQSEIGEKYGQQMDEIIKGQILQKEKEIQGRINQYFTVIEDSLKAYTADLKKRTQEVQMPFDQIKAGLEQKIAETEKLHDDYLKNLENKANLSLTQRDAALAQSLEESQRDIEQIKAVMETKIAQTEQSYENFLKSLEASMTEDFTKKQQALDVKVNEFFGQTQEILSKFLKELESRTQTQVEEEIGSAKKLIDEYKRQRLGVVDENLIAILEKTLNITLGKKLTLSDQTQLVYEALEEAKKENFFA